MSFRAGLCLFILIFQALIITAWAEKQVFAYVTFDEEIAQRFTAAFEKDTGIKVNFVRLSTGEATARIMAEKANPQASVWLGGVGLGHAELKEKGLSEPYFPTAAKSLDAKYKDKDGNWNGLYLGLLTFIVNTDLLKKKNLTAPKSWADLLDPKWKGNLQLPNPGTSGTSYTLMTTLIARDGEAKAFEYLKSLHKNVSQYTRSGQAPGKNVSIGETIVGVGFSQDILRLKYESKAPVDIIYPADGTGYEVAAVSLIKGGKEHENAKKLIDWSYTPKAAQILADHFILPLKREGVKMKQEALAANSVKLIDSQMEFAAKNKTRLIEQWNDQVNH